MADIFISYKREDQEEYGRVRPLAEALSAEGYDVFYDVQVPPGSSWESFLQSKINAARAVIVLWSNASVKSDWVKEEAEMAKNAGKLIPVFMDAVAPPFGFARIEGANLAGWDGDLQHIEWKNLVAAIKARIGEGEGQAQPEVARVAYQPAKTVTVEKRASGSGGGVMKTLLALGGIVVLAGLGLIAYNSMQQAEIARDRAADIAVDEAMTRGIDERAWSEAKEADTIAAYRRYLDLRPTGAYRAEALTRIEELEAEAAREARAATPTPSPAPQTRYRANGVYIEVTRVYPDGNTISLSRQDFAVSFTYSVPAGRRMDVVVQPRYSGPGTCRWSPDRQPGVLAGNGNFSVRFRFTGEDCRNKTLTAVNFRVAPEGDSSDWESADHDVRYSMR
ncbi:MAG: toll/interleukin-1 receptor domain-containing protein [Hyphomonadaceae bacterium]|nr:toll/interleukin-1 receptor domain-containing protein [Hyphomonadaceae bacterium]